MPKFEKGRSGNPGGRPKGVVEARELAQSKSAAIIERMAQIALDPETDPRASVAAGNAVLDRAYGKPSQHIQMQRLQSLSDEQLNAELLACIRERDSIRKA